MAKRNSISPIAYKEPKKVTIEKAQNGYIVEQWGDRGKKCIVAKNNSEAMKATKKLLGK